MRLVSGSVSGSALILLLGLRQRCWRDTLLFFPGFIELSNLRPMALAQFDLSPAKTTHGDWHVRN